MNASPPKSKSALLAFAVALMLVPAAMLWVYMGPEPRGEETFETMERDAPVGKSRIEQMEEMWQAAPGHGPVALELGHLHLAEGHFDKALGYYREFQKNDTTADGWLVQLDISRALMGLGRTADAIVELEGMLRDHPGHAGALYNLGAIEANRGHFDQARAHWRELIERHPDDTLAVFARTALPKLN